MSIDYFEAQREMEDALACEAMSTGELMRVTASQYHARGENCPWDCYSCPGNIAAEEADAEAANQEWWDSMTSEEQADYMARIAAAEDAEAARLAELDLPF